MDKIFSTRSLLTVLIVIGAVIIGFFLVRSCGGERVIRAEVSPTEITLGQWITYADSTRGASSHLWEFGNGDYSYEPSGRYLFSEEGRYQVRLRVDNKLEKLFMVRVRPDDSKRPDHLIRIVAPQTAVQGEFILFTAEGNDREWKWEFGESGIVDSREKTTIYAYLNHGTYQVSLSSENTQYPIYHQIEILPRYMETDSLDAMTMAGNDIKIRLQNIANGDSFNPNYNYILNTYLCGNPDVLVTINNNKRNDFYSYCQGLRFAGKNNTLIETVYVESDNPEKSCIDHIIVLQRNKSTDEPSGTR